MIGRAVVFDRYGDLSVLQVRPIELPEPRAGEVLVRVRAAALNPKDSFVRKGRFATLSGRRFPKRTCVDFAGEVVRGGSWTPGTRVYGALEEVTYRRGTLGELTLVREKELAAMPASLSFEQAAALPLVALTALQAMRGRFARGDRVLIHGASGGVGTAAIQIAKAYGAHVTTTSSARNQELCRSLGADRALDRESDDGLGERYTLILDAFGNLSYPKVRRALEGPGEAGVGVRGQSTRVTGTYVTTVPSPHIVFDMLRSKHARLVLVRAKRDDLETVTRMVDAGQLKPVIDRTFDFEDHAEAFRHLESKRTRGKIVVRC